MSLTAKDIMTSDVITVTPETEITKATRILLEKRVNGLPVVDADNRLVGILCQSDLVSQQKKLPLPSFFTFLDGFIPLNSMKQMERQVEKAIALTVEKAMTADPISVSPDTEIGTVAALMVDRNYHTLPVLKDGRLIGVIGKEDILKTLVPAEDG